jgi:hypothetical protein
MVTGIFRCFSQSSQKNSAVMYVNKSTTIAVLVSTQPSIQWLSGTFPGGKVAGHEADHSPPSSADVNNDKPYIHSLMCLHDVVLNYLSIRITLS